jgi:uncharacterized protein (DUF2236 family)
MDHEVARLINGERLVVLGWGRAILMQLAHPLVAAGVADHSTFRASALAPLQRLHATVEAMLDLTFGDERVASRAAARINAIHDRVNGTLREPAGEWPAGAAYSAHDPALLLWVHATLLDSLPLAYEAFVAPLAPTHIDRYIVEAASGAARLGLPENRAPQSRADVRLYLDRMTSGGEIAVTPAARLLAHDVLNPPGARLLGPVSTATRLFAVGTLPERVRAMYGFAWSDADTRRLVRVSAFLRRWRGRTPARVARWRTA